LGLEQSNHSNYRNYSTRSKKR